MAKDGRLTKAEKDYTKVVDDALPGIDQLPLVEALERISAIEKQTRQAGDLQSTTRLLIKAIQLCYAAGNWELVSDQLLAFSKKHGQLKMATTKMVQDALTLLDKTPNLDTKLKLIDTLITVTEGKVFVEVERARLTMELASIQEHHFKDVKKAQTTLCELQIETFGSMGRREKTEFILEQVRLCIAVDDYTLSGIIAKKISTRYLNETGGEEDTMDLKLKYYELMIRLDLHADKYLDVCKHYRAVYDTPKVAEDPNAWKPILQNIIFFVLLSQYDNEQSDLLARISEDKNLKELGWENTLLKTFRTEELMRWPRVAEIYGDGLRSSGATFAKGDPKGEKRYDELRKRVIEHVNNFAL